MLTWNSLYFLVMLSLLVGPTVCTEREMTISIEPGTTECFYQEAKLNEVIDIEYQVIYSLLPRFIVFYPHNPIMLADESF